MSLRSDLREDAKGKIRELFKELLSLAINHVKTVVLVALTATAGTTAVATDNLNFSTTGITFGSQAERLPAEEIFHPDAQTFRVDTSDEIFIEVIYDSVTVTSTISGSAVQVGDTGGALLTVSELWVVDSRAPDFFVQGECGDSVRSGNISSGIDVQGFTSNPYPVVVPPRDAAFARFSGTTSYIAVGDGSNVAPATGPGAIGRLIFNDVTANRDWVIQNIRAGHCYFINNEFGNEVDGLGIDNTTYFGNVLGTDVSTTYTGDLWDGSPYTYVVDEERAIDVK